VSSQSWPTLDEVRGWPATVSVPTACSALGVSRSCGYDAARRGQFPVRVIRVGGRYRVVTASLLEVLGGGAA
jgi:predicted DNA-binding transcriptional regulator AlpA